MTLLFFLRSPAGNTDTGQSPDVMPWIDHGERKPKKRTKLRAKESLEIRKLAQAAAEEAAEQARIAARKRKRKREDEALLMLFMHEFEDGDYVN